MNIKWWFNRLSVMSAPEILHRLSQMARARFERLGWGLARPSTPRGGDGRPWIEPFPASFDSDSYIMAAERVLRGSFRVFSIDDAPLGFPPAWNLDPKTGICAPLIFGKSLDYRDERLVGDCKYLWEPNRHAELVTLAQSWHLTRQPRYARGCRTLLESWFDQCPYPLGINWTSSLELAIRLINWSFAWQLLGGDRSEWLQGADGKKLRTRWLESVYRHCHFIAHHRSQYSSANNHLLGEFLGLFVAAVTWPMWPESKRWLALAQRGFEREALLQTAPDGVNREQAVWYHHEVTDMMLLAGLAGRANSIEFADGYWKRLEVMLDFIASIMDCRGHVPAFGDSDDALIVRLSPSRLFEPFRSLLATGAILFQRSDFKFKAQCFDDKSRWLLGDAAALQFASLPESSATLPVRREFADGGYYVLGESFETSEEVRIVADVASLGYLGTAAHGHADALSFTLSAGGHELLVDPGTYAYHTQKKWRDYFRGTAAHNTLRLDGVDQSTPGGNFLWTRQARARVEHWLVSPELNCLTGSHDGYTALAEPVRHRRELQYRPGVRQLYVIDSLEGVGEHRLEMFWHFSETCRVIETDGIVYATINGAELIISPPKNLTLELVSGRAEPPAGWISRRFDEKIPCVTLIVSGVVRAGWRDVTQMQVNFAPRGEGICARED